MTVYRGTIEKYLDLAQDLVRRYDLGAYNAQRLALLQDELKSLFSEDSEPEKQPALVDFL